MNILDWVGPLTKIFVGKDVVIESSSSENPEKNEKMPGICKAFHLPLGCPSINIELVGNPCQFGFVPKVMGTGFIEGDTSIPGLKRIIRLA